MAGQDGADDEGQVDLLSCTLELVYMFHMVFSCDNQLRVAHISRSLLSISGLLFEALLARSLRFVSCAGDNRKNGRSGCPYRQPGRRHQEALPSVPTEPPSSLRWREGVFSTNPNLKTPN